MRLLLYTLCEWERDYCCIHCVNGNEITLCEWEQDYCCIHFVHGNEITAVYTVYMGQPLLYTLGKFWY